MRKIFFLMVIIASLIFEMNNFIYAQDSDNQNWKSFIYDKQAWELGPVFKILIDQNELFVSGMFGYRFYDSLYFNGLAELKDSLWAPLDSGEYTGIRGDYRIINDMVKLDSILYVGGLFDSAGTEKVYNIAMWNTNSREWTALGKGINEMVTSLAIKDSILFVGGQFDSLATDTDTIRCNYIAKWDGNQWDSLGDGLNGPVYDMIVNGNNLYVVGAFDSVGTQKANHIGVWNDSSETWSSFGDYGPMGEVSSVCKIGNNVYFGGVFNSANTSSSTISCKNIVQWNGTSWDSLNDGINGRIFQMITDSSELYVVGNFIKTIDDTANCRNIAEWDGNEWNIFGSGANETIRTIALKGDSILVGGDFSFTGDTLAENIGLWYVSPPLPPKINDQNTVRDLKDNPLVLNVYPNPATNETKLEFYINKKGLVEIIIYDISGTKIEALPKAEYDPGWRQMIWKCEKFVSGTYICKMTVGERNISTKLILSK